MSDKLRRILAIIALVFILFFTVSVIIVLGNPSGFRGLGVAAIASGAVGLVIFLFLKMDTPQPSNEEIKKDGESKD